MPLSNAEMFAQKLEKLSAQAAKMIRTGRRRREEDVYCLIACLQTFTSSADRFRVGNLMLIDRTSLTRAMQRAAEVMLTTIYQEAGVEPPTSDQRVLKTQVQDIVRRNIAAIAFSTRVQNCLNSEGIYTVKDLLRHTPQELSHIRNFGATSLREVERFLTTYGLWLGMSEEQIEKITSGIPFYTPEQMQQLLDAPFSGMGLGMRAFAGARKTGAGTLKDLVLLTEGQLMDQKGLGPSSLREIKQFLAGYGLRLGMTEEELVALTAK